MERGKFTREFKLEVNDELAMGREFGALTVVDTFTRYVRVCDPRFIYRGRDVVQTLARVCSKASNHGSISVDQGSESVSCDLDPWA